MLGAAIVGGTNLILCPDTTLCLFGAGVLSPDASCKSFDASANVYARAEGITAVYIKRLGNALRNGNPVRAVIHATGSNSEGRSPGLMSPNGQAQEALIRKVYQKARLDLGCTAFVECHASGTHIGDSIEAATIGNVFVGAQVFATVGSKEKIKHLVEYYGISRDHIFSSRDASFVSGVMHETSGRGIDLVLNSLSSQLLHKSWACVAEYGIMIDLGSRDLVGAGRLNMTPFLANRSYAVVNIQHYINKRPEILARYLDMYDRGHLQPLDPVSNFDAGTVEQAFQLLQDRDHIGKVVITVPGDMSRVSSLQPTRSVLLDPEATYLLVGGSKGIGGSNATWLVEQGARNLTFLSRVFGLSSENKALFEELRLLRHTALIDMKWSEWQAVIGPKVRGTWNLHYGLADHPIDFFWMASSMISVTEQPGQGNYSAACTFLDTFCQYCHAVELPATVRNICPIDDVGYVVDNPSAPSSMKASSLYALGEPKFLDFVKLSPNYTSMTKKTAPPGEVIAVWVNITTYGRQFKKSKVMGFMDHILENVAFMARGIGKKINELRLVLIENDVEIDMRWTLAQLGLDSLMAIELK
ncbi:hypothetical protein F4678DRAFT_457324 [Xylaria arbuscula]|nr:hypothetical protein F4678DRAFT_457324 [Xylaria arbuscula]